MVPHLFAHLVFRWPAEVSRGNQMTLSCSRGESWIVDNMKQCSIESLCIWGGIADLGSRMWHVEQAPWPGWPLVQGGWKILEVDWNSIHSLEPTDGIWRLKSVLNLSWLYSTHWSVNIIPDCPYSSLHLGIFCYAALLWHGWLVQMAWVTWALLDHHPLLHCVF